MVTKNTQKRKAPLAERKSKRRKKKAPMPIFVVDEHNDAMLPFLDAIKTKKLPKSGVKLLHYDSHPDLGNIAESSNTLAT
jgi:arginase family enzyme